MLCKLAPSLVYSFVYLLLTKFAPSLVYSFVYLLLTKFVPLLIYSIVYRFLYKLCPLLVYSFLCILLYKLAIYILLALTTIIKQPHFAFAFKCNKNTYAFSINQHCKKVKMLRKKGKNFRLRRSFNASLRSQ